MANKRREHDRACHCEGADGGCAALAVQRLSRARVQELAEEIWTVSTGTAVPLQPVPDPRGSRPGASALAAYRRYRHKEHERWRRGWRSRSRAVAALAVGVWLLVGLTLGPWLGWRMAVLAAVLAWWRLLRFHPSASARLWRRQAQAQRRTAGALADLEREGYLVLHDIALPGWPGSLEHLVIGPTGAWAIESRRSNWRPRRRPATSPRPARGGIRGPRPDLSWKAEAIAESLAGTGIPVQPLLCLHVGLRHGRRQVQGIPQVGVRRLLDVLRQGSRVRPVAVERASARALEVLRPAA